jgi:hypothetical protein
VPDAQRAFRFVLPFVLALVFAGNATAGPIVDRAAVALQNSPVYVDPSAEQTITPAEAERLRTEIETKAHGPTYIAVLPNAALNEAGGDAVGVTDKLYRQVGNPGVYGVVAGGHFRALSTDLGPGKAGKLATQAFKAHRDDGIAATLSDFVDRVGAERTGKGDGGRSFGNIGLFPILLIGGILFFGYRKLKRRRADADQFREVRETAREDLVALAEDVQGLEQKVESNEPAKRDYLAALEQYSRASDAFDRARTPAQLAPIAESLEEGRYLMASAEARLAGHEPPERRPACFFDPRHGPSVRDVEWTPPGGQPRQVPACAADALRVEEGEEPQSRQVRTGGQTIPYWAAGPMYGGYFGGFFPGLLIGELMVGGFGGLGYGGDLDGGGGGDTGGDFGGMGGGDFGGGDFGGF